MKLHWAFVVSATAQIALSGVASAHVVHAVGASSVPTCSSSAGTVYTQQFCDLGPVNVIGINNAGEVIGTAVNTNGIAHATIFNAFLGLPSPLLANGQTDLKALDSLSNTSVGNGISDLWDATALYNALPSATGQSNRKAFRWTSGTMSPLGGQTTVGYGIDIQGDVTGQVFNVTADTDYAITWLSNGSVLTPLSVFGTVISSGQAIVTTTSGVSGSPVLFAGFETEGSGAEGFLYDGAVGGEPTVIAPLPGDTTLVPRAMTRSLIVGNSHGANNVQHAFASQIKAGTIVHTLELPTLGGSQAFAFGVANSGSIVGYAQDGDGKYRAVLWEPIAGTYVPIDLNTLAPPGWFLSSALGINDRNQIVGYGSNDGGITTHAFLFLPNRNVIDLALATKLPSTSVQHLAYLGYDLIVQQIYAPRQEGGSIATRAQIKSNLDSILSAKYKDAVYVFLRFDDPVGHSGAEQMGKALAGLSNEVKPSVTQFIMLDVETNCGTPAGTCYDGTKSGTTQAQRITIISDAIHSAQPSGIPILIYTQRSPWKTLIGLSGMRFSNCQLWDSKADNVSDPSVDLDAATQLLAPFKPYGVWPSRVAKQYEVNAGSNGIFGEDINGVQRFSGVGSIDISSFDWSVFDKPTSCTSGSVQ